MTSRIRNPDAHICNIVYLSISESTLLVTIKKCTICFVTMISDVSLRHSQAYSKQGEVIVHSLKFLMMIFVVCSASEDVGLELLFRGGYHTVEK